jgi:nucleotide-binding universal stress UspA family protein
MRLPLTRNLTSKVLTPAEFIPGLGSDGPRSSRSQLLVILERPNPGPWSLRKVAWVARRLGAEVLIGAIVTYDRSLNDFDGFKVGMAQEDVQDVTARLVEQGVRATAEVRLTPHGDQGRSASDLADGLDPDLVIVLARRGSCFRLFPGSPVAHHLMRQGRWPILVIADHAPRGSWRSALLGEVRTTLQGR